MDSQVNWGYNNVMNEVAKNVFVTDSIVTDLIPDPKTCLEDRDAMPVRYVGGLHNINNGDKTAWAVEVDGPLRVIETGTGREEVWFPPNWRTPSYVSLDAGGNLTSHLKLNKTRPSVVQDIQQEDLRSQIGTKFLVEFSLWYEGDILHRTPTDHEQLTPAVVSPKIHVSTQDGEYIRGVRFASLYEFWEDGEWSSTSVHAMSVIFADSKLNTPEIRLEANNWISKHCRGGFFPFSDPLFGEADEEVMFIADICSKG